MGFDVLYLPPIHPIGVTERKGKNNSLTPGADDLEAHGQLEAWRVDTNRFTRDWER